MRSDRWRVLAWQLAILVAIVAAWEYLTGIKAISRTPGLYWIDPFFISRPSKIAERFLYLASDKVRLSIWAMALSTIQSTLWGFAVGMRSADHLGSRQRSAIPSSPSRCLQRSRYGGAFGAGCADGAPGA